MERESKQDWLRRGEMWSRSTLLFLLAWQSPLRAQDIREERPKVEKPVYYTFVTGSAIPVTYDQVARRFPLTTSSMQIIRNTNQIPVIERRPFARRTVRTAVPHAK
jgi:hypothetical protein